MKATLSLFSAVVFVCVALSGSGDAKDRTPSSLPGTAVFRCNFTAECTGLTASDAIWDGRNSNYDGIGAAESGQGAHLNGNKELWLGLGEGYYQLEFQFPVPVVAGSCQNSNTCRLWSSFPSLTIDQENAEFQSNVVGPEDS